MPGTLSALKRWAGTMGSIEVRAWGRAGKTGHSPSPVSPVGARGSRPRRAPWRTPAEPQVSASRGGGEPELGDQGAADPYPRRLQPPGPLSAPTPRRRLGELRGSARMPGPKPGRPRSVQHRRRRRRRTPAPCPCPARSPLRLTGTSSGESLVARRPRRPGCSGLGGSAAPREPTRRRGAGGGAAPRGQPGGRPGGGDPGPAPAAPRLRLRAPRPPPRLEAA